MNGFFYLFAFMLTVSVATFLVIRGEKRKAIALRVDNDTFEALSRWLSANDFSPARSERGRTLVLKRIEAHEEFMDIWKFKKDRGYMHTLYFWLGPPKTLPSLP